MFNRHIKNIPNFQDLAKHATLYLKYYVQFLNYEILYTRHRLLETEYIFYVGSF